ncbi:3,4-dioxygenase subunit beta [Actinoplanes cyaneus]|uniref:3,4-dioxygenase subunit beta n=1 Tax=Actinoplanes cyaneus TaxID=52696 RepID=A0A919M7H1_9ACTN|nr:intradiol ring-cleavage dioxygenase [Actinoplanes cyaneus]MCW2142814.1 Dioxygenase [Actinoplanes cyaneus]GID68782.1 3,4-dioxygenase subunit beta [Actinoplanes cyaneus]
MTEQERDNAAYVREVHDKGLAFDLGTMNRRRMLTLIGGAGAAAVVTGTLIGTAGPAAAAELAEIETETAGPYPADGSNGVDVRTESGIVRSDIRSSFGTSATVADGVPLEFSITVVDLAGAPVAGAAVYAWHCDRDGNYSLYSTGITGENYLRGIQETGTTGTATFTSIFPACYSGRWPHIHFEVYSSLANATSGDGPIVKTSQIAIPEDIADLVYATDGYSKSVTNLSQVSLATDNVFGDDSAARELATVTGSVAAGFTASLTAAVDPAGTEQSGGGGTPPAGGPPVAPSATATATAATTEQKTRHWWNPFSW